MLVGEQIAGSPWLILEVSVFPTAAVADHFWRSSSVQVFQIPHRNPLGSSGPTITPSRRGTLSSRFELKNLACSSLEFSQVASSVGRSFHFTRLSSTNGEPFFSQQIPNIASGWRIILPSSVAVGSSSLGRNESPIFFFSRETWNTGSMQDSRGSLSL